MKQATSMDQILKVPLYIMKVGVVFFFVEQVEEQNKLLARRYVLMVDLH